MNRLIIIAAAFVAAIAAPAHAATERMPCKSTEARATVSGAYVWVSCPTEGRLMPEGMEIHYQGDKRDYVVRSLKLVALDGPLGGAVAVTPTPLPDPRIKVIDQRWPGLLDKLTN